MELICVGRVYSTIKQKPRSSTTKNFLNPILELWCMHFGPKLLECQGHYPEIRAQARAVYETLQSAAMREKA